ncbi:hemophore-related protein [Mycolicibacterium palauense]|uniref:hemophore-related protein n=1 Tax=Mycolicibacterium palauense TaxID=2034511 RepID=UPI000BFEC53C|nr:hemophore-related protein [Mycolicibacterium palauense]
MKLLTAFGVSVTAALVGLAAATGVAGAAPIDGPLINTDCSYAQLNAALSAEDPGLADMLAQRPEAQAKIQEFVALAPDQRKARVDDLFARNPEWRAKFDAKRATPEGQEKQALADRVAGTCHNY